MRHCDKVLRVRIRIEETGLRQQIRQGETGKTTTHLPEKLAARPAARCGIGNKSTHDSLIRINELVQVEDHAAQLNQSSVFRRRLPVDSPKWIPIFLRIRSP